MMRSVSARSCRGPPRAPRRAAGRAVARVAVRAAAASGPIDGVDVGKANELLQSGFVYLDVRTPEEFSEGRVEGSVNIPVFFSGAGGMVPNADFVGQVQEEFPDKDTPMLLGCRSGRRSLVAGELLQSAEYCGPLLNVDGGFMDWQQQGLEWVN
mmetsp:Transcript_19946/g.56064  ORF Transcript_19946/g.56064 Transcript_19946/m.56064 type:complete len:154 (-) Transcript_19946:138-599(-)